MQLNSAFLPSIHHVQDELAGIIKEPIAKNTHCSISWIRDFDCRNSDHINKTTDELLMIESANLVNIIDQLTAFAKDSGCKVTIGGFQGPVPLCVDLGMHCCKKLLPWLASLSFSILRIGKIFDRTKIILRIRTVVYAPCKMAYVVYTILEKIATMKTKRRVATDPE